MQLQRWSAKLVRAALGIQVGCHISISCWVALAIALDGVVVHSVPLARADIIGLPGGYQSWPQCSVLCCPGNGKESGKVPA